MGKLADFRGRIEEPRVSGRSSIERQRDTSGHSEKSDGTRVRQNFESPRADRKRWRGSRDDTVGGIISRSAVTLYTKVFNRRDRQSGEKVREYVKALQQLADSCHFGDFRELLIRDSLVAGCSEQQMKEKMLEKMRRFCNPKFAIRNLQSEIREN